MIWTSTCQDSSLPLKSKHMEFKINLTTILLKILQSRKDVHLIFPNLWAGNLKIKIKNKLKILRSKKNRIKKQKLSIKSIRNMKKLSLTMRYLGIFYSIKMSFQRWPLKKTRKTSIEVKTLDINTSKIAWNIKCVERQEGYLKKCIR